MSHQPAIRLHAFRREGRVFPMRLVDRRTRAGIDLTGSVLTFTVRSDLSQTTPEIQIATGAQLVHDPDQVANPGKFTLTLTVADLTIAVGDYFWDLFKDDQLMVDPTDEPQFEVGRSARYGPA